MGTCCCCVGCGLWTYGVWPYRPRSISGGIWPDGGGYPGNQNAWRVAPQPQGQVRLDPNRYSFETARWVTEQNQSPYLEIHLQRSNKTSFTIRGVPNPKKNGCIEFFDAGGGPLDPDVQRWLGGGNAGEKSRGSYVAQKARAAAQSPTQYRQAMPSAGEKAAPVPTDQKTKPKKPLSVPITSGAVVAPR